MSGARRDDARPGDSRVDATGLAPVPKDELVTTAPAPTSKQIGAALQPVQDPEIHISIVDLGLVYGASVATAAEGGHNVTVRMTLTSPMCPYGPMLLAMVHGAVAKLPGVREVQVDLTFEPVWDPRTMATDECKDQLGIY
jgi:metal-sulfur cluster biosynthetic enzyme